MKHVCIERLSCRPTESTARISDCTSGSRAPAGCGHLTCRGPPPRAGATTAAIARRLVAVRGARASTASTARTARRSSGACSGRSWRAARSSRSRFWCATPRAFIHSFAFDSIRRVGPSLALVPIRQRSRGERRSLRTFAVVSLRPPPAQYPPRRPRQSSLRSPLILLRPAPTPGEDRARPAQRRRAQASRR